MDLNVLFARLAWILLMLVMIVRPVNDLWSGRQSKWLMKHRKHIGIAAGLSALAHVLYYYFSVGFDYTFWLGPVWNFTTLLGWGMLALVFILPPLITSNVFSQKLLRKNWKLIQRLSYPAFIFTGIHVAFISGYLFYGILPVIVWLVLWLAALFKSRKKILSKG